MVIEQKVSSKIPGEAAIENANYGTVYAVGLARVVAKEGKGKDRGKTIRPEVLFKDLYQLLPPRGTAADALRILTDVSVPPPTSSIQANGKKYPIEMVQCG
ncbi:hypothetical protein SARC_02536 [Sphaeroforma arctica JP610]|uniref:Uncharacterized protein n=1 Tax=Sphaeroforma arctica JP610 TaxID=667725 RepID=A0A0L0G8B2_9EUKA|nr:hypothetical protein SARC_02536 [Sphaeroforma arctica JP610]KNC85277.1 hypothetical protein SARC_02536 [Sphaeroforma arctica JP610]|eukprot:XP_014159179.1 hypothetical protein SARC_02536 [Sphaeroforma arctica JP610]